MKKTKITFAAIITAALLSGCSSPAMTSGGSTLGNADTAIYGGQDDIYDNGIAYSMAEEAVADGAWDIQLPDYNTEEYGAIVENAYKSTAASPLSTFSADVDTASYSNLRRMITEGGYEIPKGAVRLEEMLNYFDYEYPSPVDGEPFSVTTEISDCPWNKETKLMLIGLHTKDIDLSKRPPMNLVFLIDTSGSMDEYDKLPLVQRSFSILTENLNENDRVSIVTYASDDKIVLEGASAADKEKITDAINALEAGGYTAGSKGINTAYEIAERYFIENGNNRIILATDGDLNVGVTSESELKSLVEQKRESGIFLSVLGFGTGNIKDNKMETLADNGNGNYSYIDSELEAKRVLTEQMSGTLFTVAKDVKLQIEFNPFYIKGYRLIGYENRIMADEDFKDDSKDAGEIGAGHSVTALYEIILPDSKIELDTSDLKYQDSAKGKENGEWLTLSIRYKQPDGDESKQLSYPVKADIYSADMSERLNFASCVVQFGMLLRNSEYKGTATYDTILEGLEKYDYDKDVYKDEFIYLVKTMQRKG